ncbi:hypothetical protein VNO80_25585 [Phaseolus coccineus]|uniref:Uncharacterized protein n=1 Tax=Phaseolus coccineus TaxID=3886 RepID=A0AAN9LV24_PHACN
MTRGEDIKHNKESQVVGLCHDFWWCNRKEQIASPPCVRALHRHLRAISTHIAASATCVLARTSTATCVLARTSVACVLPHSIALRIERHRTATLSATTPPSACAHRTFFYTSL